jgi:prepilin-type processing-associated H-X9-DG protein
MAYAAENNQYLPVSYNYRNQSRAADGSLTLTGVPYGYVHWSFLVSGTVPPGAYQCPSIANGGLPQTDPATGDFDGGQVIDTSDTGTSDPNGRVTPVTFPDGTGSPKTYMPDSYGGPRMAYTLNEAICGRNKFPGFGGLGATKRPNRFVALTEIENQSGTILGTEYVDSWQIVSGAAKNSATSVCKSHRPLTGFRSNDSAVGDAACDLPSVAPGTPAAPGIRRVTQKDLWNTTTAGTVSVDILADYASGKYTTASSATRLDWVGRNHSKGDKPTDNKSNFLYVDGHVETKSVLETVPADSTTSTPFEWGKKLYSYTVGDDIAP